MSKVRSVLFWCQYTLLGGRSASVGPALALAVVDACFDAIWTVVEVDIPLYTRRAGSGLGKGG